MKIELTPSQTAILQAAVAAGEFPSIEASIQQAIEMVLPLDTDDLGGAKPFVDEARASVAKGEYITFEEFQRDLRETIARFQTR